MAAKLSGLQLCDVIQCNYCGQKHTAIRGDTTDVDSVKAMPYVVCTKPKTNLRDGMSAYEKKRGKRRDHRTR